MIFSQIGYELKWEKERPTAYWYTKINGFDKKEIVIDKINKCVTVIYSKINGRGYDKQLLLDSAYLTYEELQAINEVVESLNEN